MNTAQTAKSRSLRSTIASIADVLSGAGACAVAAKTGRTPSHRALNSVGIEVEAWNRIVRR